MQDVKTSELAYLDHVTAPVATTKMSQGHPKFVTSKWGHKPKRL